MTSAFVQVQESERGGANNHFGRIKHKCMVTLSPPSGLP